MFILKDYQSKAVDRLLEETYSLIKVSNRRSKLILKSPTGSGKTIIMSAYLNKFAQEIEQQFDIGNKKYAFIWIAPNQLHIQSYEKIKHFFEEIRTLRPINFEDITDGQILPNDILFLNWQSISSDKNIFVKENELNKNLFEYVNNSKANDVEIITILDEAHLFASRGRKANSVLKNLDSLIEIDVSATPYFTSDYTVVVKRDEVVTAQMIKKGVNLNPSLSAAAHYGETLNESLLKEALSKRNELAEKYKSLGKKINPLLLIQLPSETIKDSVADNETKDFVLTSLQAKGITTQNNKLAVWLSNEKTNLDNISEDDDMVEVLLFKQAIALGWDCPRAAVLLIFREIKQETFSIQTVGRILRMPEKVHYADEALNYGYVYTNLSRDIIRIVADDMDYITEYKALRKDIYQDINLESTFINRRILRNRLGSKFRLAMYKAVEEHFGISIELEGEESPFIKNINLLKSKFIETNVDNIEIVIPKDIVIQAEESIHVIDQEHKERFAKTMDELSILFLKFCRDNVGGYAKVDSTPVMELALKMLFEEYFQLDEYSAIKIILHPPNQNEFLTVIGKALEIYESMMIEKANSTSIKPEKYNWEIPEFRIYNDKYTVYPTLHHIMDPTYLFKRPSGKLAASDTEFSFVEFLEQNKQHINWWYKNGESNRSDFAVEYQNVQGVKSAFYVDFIIQFKNGTIGLFDTKTIKSDSDMKEKHNGLIHYIETETKKSKNIVGGIIVPHKGTWRFPNGKIDNDFDVDGWEYFTPSLYNN